MKDVPLLGHKCPWGLSKVKVSTAFPPLICISASISGPGSWHFLAFVLSHPDTTINSSCTRQLNLPLPRTTLWAWTAQHQREASTVAVESLVSPLIATKWPMTPTNLPGIRRKRQQRTTRPGKLSKLLQSSLPRPSQWSLYQRQMKGWLGAWSQCPQTPQW